MRASKIIYHQEFRVGIKWVKQSDILGTDIYYLPAPK